MLIRTEFTNEVGVNEASRITIQNTLTPCIDN